MFHKAWNSKGEMPFCFPRSSIKFQGHTVQNITDFDPNLAFPDYRPVAAFKSLRFALFFFFSLSKLKWPKLLPNLFSSFALLSTKWLGKCTLVLTKYINSIITGDPLHSRAACRQPCNVNTHSRAHCSPGARLCEQWGHGCVNNGARLCASARLCRGSPVILRLKRCTRYKHSLWWYVYVMCVDQISH